MIALALNVFRLRAFSKVLRGFLITALLLVDDVDDQLFEDHHHTADVITYVVINQVWKENNIKFEQMYTNFKL